MLLAVDIGNTNIKFGVYDGERLVGKLAVPTIRDISAEGLAKVAGARISQPITAAIASSVVPEVNGAVRSFLTSQYNIEPMIVTNDTDFGMTIKHEPLSEAGTDRLVNAFSAVEKHGAPLIVCSFGTALTIDYVNKYRVLIGGVIAPGMKSLAIALNKTTSKLPEVEIERPDAVIQNTTVRSIQSGIVFGYTGLVKELLSAIKTEIGDSPKIIATGGYARLVAETVPEIDIIEEILLLDGLQILHERGNG